MPLNKLRFPNARETELIVALDVPRTDEAFRVVDALQGLPVILKVGSELFLQGGPELVRELVHRKHRVFLDLKFHDIPNTVAKAVKQAALLQVDMLTVHVAGGSAMMNAVAKELEEIPELRPILLGITVLTSFDDVRWAEVTRALTDHAVTPGDSVRGLVDSAARWGFDGVVCSAHELETVRELAPSLYTVVPGIRLELGASDDQARVMTPAEAHAAGARAIVMGRPILGAQDRRATVEKVLTQLQG